MTPLLFLGVAVAGGLGAVLRFVIDGEVRARLGGNWPWGTLLINITGSLVLGFLTEAVLGGLLAAEWRVVIGTGLLGGYTTFSTASLETVRLAQAGRLWRAVGYAAVTLVAAVVAALMGLALAGLFR